MSDDTKTLKIPPATKAHQLVVFFGADLKSNKLIVFTLHKSYTRNLIYPILNYFDAGVTP